MNEVVQDENELEIARFLIEQTNGAALASGGARTAFDLFHERFLWNGHDSILGCFYTAHVAPRAAELGLEVPRTTVELENSRMKRRLQFDEQPAAKI